MANTFSQIYIQIVIGVKRRQNMLLKPWREDVFKYMAGIITQKGQKSIIVNGVSDHVHIFVGIKPSICISELVRDIKNNTTKFINDNGFLSVPFEWQVGFGAFSYSHSHIDRVYKYILNQEKHHQRKSFKEEYLALLKKFEIEYEEKYLFEWFD